ncbi:cytochrome P450 [Mycena olivaceomarginata]|nr:cytochrome P450 [Mycena olivaceomarginata]
MAVASDLLLPLLGSLAFYALLRVAIFLYRDFTAPSAPSIWYGSFNELAADHRLMPKWRAEYGRNFQFRGLFNIRELHTSDPKAMAHIVANTVTYQKSPATRYNVVRMLGNGILAVELNEHKLQTPAFGVKHTKELTPVFVQHANELRDYWIAELGKEKAKENDNSLRIEVFAWLRKAALDVIGETALGANGRADTLFHSSGAQRNFVLRAAQANFSILQLIPLPNRDAAVFLGAKKKLFDIGAQLVAESKAYIEAAAGRRTRAGGRSASLPESERLTDEAVIAQVPSFVVAGHENTSSGMAWTLHQLSLNPDVQRKLREELLAVETDTPSYELNALPYLEKVIRETMRLHAPVDFTGRMAMADDVIPLQTPYVDKKGKVHDSIPVRKGQKIHVPITALNVDKELWGDDAEEFKPERWDAPPKAIAAIPSVYANLFTFYAAGTRVSGSASRSWSSAQCSSRSRAFEFGEAVPREAIGRTSATSLQKPIVLAERGKGTQMPLVVKLYRG